MPLFAVGLDARQPSIGHPELPGAGIGRLPAHGGGAGCWIDLANSFAEIRVSSGC